MGLLYLYLFPYVLADMAVEDPVCSVEWQCVGNYGMQAGETLRAITFYSFIRPVFSRELLHWSQTALTLSWMFQCIWQ